MNQRRLPTAGERPDRVLVVDDEPVIQELVREVMHEYEIISALTIAEARAYVASGQVFEAALVDKNLPDGSGIDLVRLLRTERPESEVVMITAYPSMDSALEAMSLGAMDYLIKPLRDISELHLRVGNACDRARNRRAEVALVAALRDSEESYRELFAATPDAILVIDSESRKIVSVNAAAERLYGRTRDELLGRISTDLTAATPTPTITNGTVTRRDLCSDGTSFPVEVSTSTAKRAGSTHVIEVIRDVSERERAEEERRELERRLARAGRLEALGRMAAGIAHDVNNMLCVIRTNNEMALDALTPDHIAREDLQQIEQAVVNAADLTRRLLSFSGRQLASERVLDVNDTVSDVSKLIGRTLEARTKLVLDLSKTPLFVKLDPGQLEQVIANLVVNARDAMPDGGTITVETRTIDREHGRIVVRDTGVGIAPALLANIWEPFFTTKGSAGTGLGLATVREIVDRTGGTIDVTSQLGVGTEFRIQIALSSESPNGLVETVRGPIIAGRGEGILLVEDDPLIRSATHRLLGGAGYAVRGTDTAEHALELARSQDLRIVITDVDLPGMSGTDLGHRLVASGANLRMIYTSGHASTVSAHGGAPFLAKPYSSDDLLRCVRRTLDLP